MIRPSPWHASQRPPLTLKREATRAVAARAGFRHAGEQFADRREQPGVGRRIGARRTADRALVDVHDLVQVLQALDAVVCGRFQRRGAVQCRGAQREQRVVDQRRLARTGHAGDAGQQADRNFQIDIVQVVAARALEVQRQLLVARRALGRNRDLHSPGQVFAGQRVRVRHDFCGRALGDDLAAVHAGARADVDHVVGQADRVFVVLDHDHRVADVAQVLERAEQAIVVALMQADRRFVEDVHHADQAGADLAGQANPLRFAAGQGVGAAIQRQVVEADVDQELQALADFLEDLVGNFAAAPGQLQPAEVLARHRRSACW